MAYGKEPDLQDGLLRYIPHLACPTCKAGRVSERVKSRHCNGEQFEEREFACGCMLEYAPNFMKTRIGKKCPNDPQVRERKEKIDKQKKRFLDLARELGWSERNVFALRTALDYNVYWADQFSED